MEKHPDRASRRWLWWLVPAGLVTPWVVKIAAGWFYNPGRPGEQIAETLSGMFRPGFNYFLVGALNAIPFVLIVVLGRLPLEHTPRGKACRRWALSGAILTVWVTTFGMQLIVWADVYGPAGSSTAALGLFFLPVYASVAGLLAFALGWGLRALIGQWRRSP